MLSREFCAVHNKYSVGLPTRTDALSLSRANVHKNNRGSTWWSREIVQPPVLAPPRRNSRERRECLLMIRMSTASPHPLAERVHAFLSSSRNECLLVGDDSRGAFAIHVLVHLLAVRGACAHTNARAHTRPYRQKHTDLARMFSFRL